MGLTVFLYYLFFFICGFSSFNFFFICGRNNNNTVEPLIAATFTAATFTAKVRWPLVGGGRYSEVYYKYGKAFGTEG